LPEPSITIPRPCIALPEPCIALPGLKIAVPNADSPALSARPGIPGRGPQRPSAHKLAPDGEREQSGLHGAEYGFEHDETLRGVRRRARLRLSQSHHAQTVRERARPPQRLAHLVAPRLRRLLLRRNPRLPTREPDPRVERGCEQPHSDQHHERAPHALAVPARQPVPP